MAIHRAILYTAIIAAIRSIGVDLLLNGYSIEAPTPGYREDPDFPLECAVEITGSFRAGFIPSRKSGDGATANRKCRRTRPARRAEQYSVFAHRYDEKTGHV